MKNRALARKIGVGTVLALWLAPAGNVRAEDPETGIHDGKLSACPSSPNCVSSEATDEDHRIGALRIEGSPEVAWRSLVEALESLPRVEIVTNRDSYLHAVFTTALMRYRDDVEFLMKVGDGEISVRSASRVGYSDMGANRDRIESIRSMLDDKGVLKRVDPAATQEN